jgi:two-component system chemotaxis sensor kinase CheA
MQPDPEVLALAREEAAECLDRIEANLLALESGDGPPDSLDAVFRDAHSVKGSAGMVGWHEASSIAHAMEDRLAEAREQGSFPHELADPLLRAVDSLRRAVAGETGVAPGVIAELDAESAPTTNGAPALEAAAAAPAGPRRPEERQSIRVATQKVDRMLDAVGETVINHGRLEHVLGEGLQHSGDEATEEELGIGERLLHELQDSVIEMRTLPLSSITAPFPRAVRDLAATQGKEVVLEIDGAETQLDRVILDGISEPIIHMLRNTVAHGIEMPDEREAAGKPSAGRVQLRAEQRGGLVAIEISDDGRGVAPELVARAHAESVSLADVLAAAGVSTTAEVTEVSGRGVGLDAVKSHVEGLGGSLEVRSEPGAGTEVTMLLPLTLALLRVLLLERAGQRFGLPVSSVREVVSINETTSLEGRPAIDLRGEAVPVVDLFAPFGIEGPELPELPPALVLESPGRRVAIACDEVLGDEEVITKSLGPLLANVPGFLGATILGDGGVALILDPNHLIKGRQAAGGAAPRRAVAAEAPSAPKILVVDDQFTVRELQRSILETAGYQVELARNGREALDRVGGEPDVDLVLSDVSMPEMDGFALLEAIRRRGENASLPVVIVTSQSGDEDRRRGVELGADAYIIKDEFDQQALLETIARLVGR